MKTSEEVLQGRFTRNLFTDQALKLNKTINEVMRSRNFSSNETMGGRKFTVTDKSLEYSHPLVVRFIDMSYRKLEGGDRKKKVSHPVHNAPIFKHATYMIQELAFGYVQTIREQVGNMPSSI